MAGWVWPPFPDFDHMKAESLQHRSGQRMLLAGDSTYLNDERFFMRSRQEITMSKQILGVAAVCLGMLAGAAGAQTASQDKSFLKDSAQGNMAEVEFGKLAAEKSSNGDVKAFADKMQHDHTMLAEQMKPFMEKMNVTAPSGLSMKDKAELEKLKHMSGESFDKEYVSFMVKDHHNDLESFIKEEHSTRNGDLKASVEKGEQVIKEHFEIISGIAKKMGMNPPPLPAGA
jgi:predicted outer membrane protein